MPLSVDQFVSTLPRTYLSVPTPKSMWVKSVFCGFLVSMLMLPPAPPRPLKAESAPLITSTCCTLKVSREPAAMSRKPSIEMLCCELMPRIYGWSPVGLPPSPAPKVMPGVERKASSKLFTPRWSNTSRVITCTVLGVSRKGAVNLLEADSLACIGLLGLAVTSMFVNSVSASTAGAAHALVANGMVNKKAAMVGATY